MESISKEDERSLDGGKDLFYPKEEFHKYVELENQGNDEAYKKETVRDILSSFMRSDEDTALKGEAIKDSIEKVLKDVRQESVYVLSNVNNETRTFIVKKINLPKGSYKLGMYKMQYAYLEKICALIGYGIMIMDLDMEESINLKDNLDERDKMMKKIITSIRPECDLSQSFLADPEKVAEFNRRLGQRLEENSLKLYRGKKNADKMNPPIF